jgi:hypothetical protein
MAFMLLVLRAVAKRAVVCGVWGAGLKAAVLVMARRVQMPMKRVMVLLFCDAEMAN